MFQEHFKQYFNKLIQFDKKTLHQLIFIFQYNILYVILAFVIGSSINYLFPNYDENKNNTTIIKEVLLQIIVLSFFIFYAQKIINCVPYIGMHYMDGERILNFYQDNFYIPSFPIGIILFTIVLIATQNNLIDKINLLNQRYQFKYDNLYQKTNTIYHNTINNQQTNEEENIQNIQNNPESNNNTTPELHNDSQLNNESSNTNNKEYQDRLLPFATRDTNEKKLYNQESLNNQHTEISKLIINNQPNNMNNNDYMNRNNNDNMNRNMNDNMSNNMNNNMNDDMNNIQFNYANPSQHLKINENTFKPLETNGNFSLLHDNTNNDINSSKLNYSDVLNSMHN